MTIHPISVISEQLAAGELLVTAGRAGTGVTKATLHATDVLSRRFTTTYLCTDMWRLGARREELRNVGALPCETVGVRDTVDVAQWFYRRLRNYELHGTALPGAIVFDNVHDLNTDWTGHNDATAAVALVTAVSNYDVEAVEALTGLSYFDHARLRAGTRPMPAVPCPALVVAARLKKTSVGGDHAAPAVHDVIGTSELVQRATFVTASYLDEDRDCVTATIKARRPVSGL